LSGRGRAAEHDRHAGNDSGPSPKVVNALIRRNCTVVATEGSTICHHSPDAPSREGWYPVAPLPALVETSDDD
jgi:hypothetical protein